AGAAIGQSANIQVKRGWHEAPLLYMIITAPPGKAKTPAINRVVKPLTEIDRGLREKSARARQEWEEGKNGRSKEDFVTPIGEELPELSEATQAPPPVQEPPQLRAIVRDITRESLVIILKENPRGVLCDPDEASGWVASFNEYKGKGGSDRQFWLSIWGCKSV